MIEERTRPTGPDAYIALVASLPGSERLFAAKQPPLSRLRLDRRLDQLTPEDRRLLGRIENVASWSHYDLGTTDADALAKTKSLIAELTRPTLAAILTERLDLRTLVAALRRRRDGMGPPEDRHWGFGRFLPAIRANWAEPAFRLERAVKWLPEAARLVAARDPLLLERHLIEVTHHQLRRHRANHGFDFEAVVIYVLTWSIYDRWARTDPVAASRRFETLAEAALTDFALPETEG